MFTANMDFGGMDFMHINRALCHENGLGNGIWNSECVLVLPIKTPVCQAILNTTGAGVSGARTKIHRN